MPGRTCFLPLLLFVTLIWAASGRAQELIGPHGFLTLEAEISNRDSVGERGTFNLHHFNLMGSFLLDDKSRVFGEIEWEHGTDTNFEDRGETAGFVRLERAWFEYVFSDQVTLRLGKFLTPYGIYNEIHDAAPAFDTSILPTSIYGKHDTPFGPRQRFYAKFAIGAQLLGKIKVGQTHLVYHLLLANGRGAKPFQQDDNGNKAVGLRLISEFHQAGVTLGYSLYTDRNGLVDDTRQTSHAWDLRWEFRRWRVGAELALSQLQASERVAHPELNSKAVYGELAYQLRWPQTLLVRYDLFEPGIDRLNDWVRDLTIGTNFDVNHKTVIKSEVHIRHEETAARRNYILAIASLAVVF